jgi:arginyl-tRNA synthetase
MQEQIRTAILEALKTLKIEGGDFVVDHPTDKNTAADYFSNVAMVVAKKIGKSPVEVAEMIKDSFLLQIVTSVEVAGPGFLNFYVDHAWYTNQLKAILSDEDNWAKGESQKGEVVLVEYTSPNLFKPLHIGNLVGNIVGEALTRLFEFGGATVKRLNYPSDIGLTVAKAVWGLTQTGGNPEDINQLGEAYRFGNDAYENDEAAKTKIVEVNHALYAGSDNEIMALRVKGIARAARCHLRSAGNKV